MVPVPHVLREMSRASDKVCAQRRSQEWGGQGGQRVHSQLSEGPLVGGLVLGLGSSKVIQTAKNLTSPKVFREVLA